MKCLRLHLCIPWLHWPFVVVHRLSLAVARGDYSLAAAHWLLCSGVSCFGVPALGTRASTAVALGLSNTGSAAVVHGLSCPTASGISWTKDQTHVLCFSVWILNHWTTREVQEVLLK